MQYNFSWNKPLLAAVLVVVVIVVWLSRAQFMTSQDDPGMVSLVGVAACDDETSVYPAQLQMCSWILSTKDGRKYRLQDLRPQLDKPTVRQVAVGCVTLWGRIIDECGRQATRQQCSEKFAYYDVRPSNNCRVPITAIIAP